MPINPDAVGAESEPVEDPTKLGPVVAELLSGARVPAGMDGRDGSWPIPKEWLGGA